MSIKLKHMNIKRSTLVFIILIFTLLLAISLVACSDKEVLMFGHDRYVLYLDKKPSMQIGVISSKYHKVALTSSNDTIVKVEGGNIIGLKEGIVTLHAKTKSKIATADVLVFKKRSEAFLNFPSDGHYSVYFSAADVPATQSHLERVPKGSFVDPPQIYNEPIDGFSFAGWFLDPLFEKPFDFETPIYKTISLYPKFEPGEPIFESEFISNTDNSARMITGLKYATVPYKEIELPTEYTYENDDGEMRTVPFTTIDSDAFKNNKYIEKITIPSCYKTIRNSSFENLFKLTEVVFLGSGLETIGEKAFKNCKELEKIELKGTSLREMGQSAFENAKSLATFSFGSSNSLEFIPDNCFEKTETLTSIVIPDSVTKLGNRAFASSGLTTINMNNVSFLDDRVFDDCTDLKEIDGNKADFEFIGEWVFGRYSLFVNDQTPWLLDRIGEISSLGIVRYKNALIYARVQSALKKHFVVPGENKDWVTCIASRCFEDVNGATVQFEQPTPPNIGNYVFGANKVTEGNLSYYLPTVDIIISTPSIVQTDVDTYIDAWLELWEEDDTQEYSIYSWSLANRIYAAKNIGLLRYAYKDELKQYYNTQGEIQWDFVKNGYRAVMLNSIELSSAQNNVTLEIDIINNLNTIKNLPTLTKVGASSTTSPKKITLEIIKHYALYDAASSSTKYNGGSIIEVILPDVQYEFQTTIVNKEGTEKFNNFLIIEECGICLINNNASIKFKNMGNSFLFGVAILEHNSSIVVGSNGKIITERYKEQYKDKWSVYPNIINKLEE